MSQKSKPLRKRKRRKFSLPPILAAVLALLLGWADFDMPIVIVCWTIVLPWLVWEFLRYQHGFKQIDRDLIIGLIAPMALLVTVEFRLINNYYPFIAVEPPGAFQLNTGQYPTKQTVRVTNTKSATLYSVFVKIWTEDKGVEAADIMIEPDKPTRPDLTGKMGQYTISSDVMMRILLILMTRGCACSISRNVPSGNTISHCLREQPY
jgi:hypothetical protein